MAGLARLASLEPPRVHRCVRGPAAPPLAVLEAAPPSFVVRRVAAGRCRTKAALLAELARAFAFPAHFGENWDALAECLADLEWLPATGYRLVVTEAEALLADAGRRRGAEVLTLVAVLRQAGREWALPRGGAPPRPAAPFHAVFVVSAGTRRAPRWGLPELTWLPPSSRPSSSTRSGGRPSWP